MIDKLSNGEMVALVVGGLTILATGIGVGTAIQSSGDEQPGPSDGGERVITETVTETVTEVVTKSPSAQTENDDATSPSDSGGRQAAVVEGYSSVYEAEAVSLPSTGCGGGPVWIDLDDPAVAVNQVTDSTTDVSYFTCAVPPTLAGHDRSLTEVDSVSVRECVKGLRSRPILEVADIVSGSIVCAMTTRDVVAAIEVVDVNDERTNVRLTAWEEVE